ncbi:MAG: hypothetical protein RMI04_09585, partial [Thermofilaceae archaeon]|nr:hypothetical protein [Thermofilaceae archaeon]
LKLLTSTLNPRAKHEIRLFLPTPMYTYLLEKTASLGFNSVSEYLRHLIAVNMEREAGLIAVNMEVDTCELKERGKKRNVLPV